MRRARPVMLAAALAMVLLLPVAPGAQAERTEAAAPDPQTEYRKLTKQAAQLNKAYRGEIQSLEETRREAARAARRAQRVGRDLAIAQREVGWFARTTYMGGVLDASSLLGVSGDPTTMLGQVATLSHLSDERARQLERVRKLAADSRKAKKAADAKIVSLKKEINTLKSRRVEIEKLLAKYGFQRPSGSAGLTARMVTVRDTVLQNFPMPYGYGCLRQGDPGDHGSGRACDFMMSTGGRMPTQVDMERGDRLAQYLIDNGSRLGVMYLIWKQRYYDVRTGSGWRPMANRGSNTANHWDHVHVSVF